MCEEGGLSGLGVPIREIFTDIPKTAAIDTFQSIFKVFTILYVSNTTKKEELLCPVRINHL